MKKVFLKFITVASFQIGVTVIGLPNIFNLKKSKYINVFSKYHK